MCFDVNEQKKNVKTQEIFRASKCNEIVKMSEGKNTHSFQTQWRANDTPFFSLSQNIPYQGDWFFSPW